MQALVGTHSGLLKLVSSAHLKFTSQESQALQKAIVSITPSSTDSCLVARKNGILSIWNFDSQT